MTIDERPTHDPEFDAFVDAGTAGANADAFREGLETRRQIVALGAQLRAARERAGLSQAELATRASLTQSAVSRLELGTMDRGGPALRTLLRYARGCGLELGFELRPQRAPATEGDVVVHIEDDASAPHGDDWRVAGDELRTPDLAVVVREIEAIEQVLDSIEWRDPIKGARPTRRLRSAASKLAQMKQRLTRNEPSGSGS